MSDALALARPRSASIKTPPGEGDDSYASCVLKAGNVEEVRLSKLREIVFVDVLEENTPYFLISATYANSVGSFEFMPNALGRDVLLKEHSLKFGGVFNKPLIDASFSSLCVERGMTRGVDYFVVSESAWKELKKLGGGPEIKCFAFRTDHSAVQFPAKLQLDVEGVDVSLDNDARPVVNVSKIVDLTALCLKVQSSNLWSSNGERVTENRPFKNFESSSATLLTVDPTNFGVEEKGMDVLEGIPPSFAKASLIRRPFRDDFSSDEDTDDDENKQPVLDEDYGLTSYDETFEPFNTIRRSPIRSYDDFSRGHSPTIRPYDHPRQSPLKFSDDATLFSSFSSSHRRPADYWTKVVRSREPFEFSHTSYTPSYAPSYAPLARTSTHEHDVLEELYFPTDEMAKHVVGLRNLVNTCYANSTLQCLWSCAPLVDWIKIELLKNDFQEKADLSSKINELNPLGTKGKIANAFVSLTQLQLNALKRARSIVPPVRREVISPGDFRRVLGEAHEDFGGVRQHDAQEFVSFLIDSLHEDFNSRSSSPYVVKPEKLKSENLETFANRIFEWHANRNSSPIDDLFTGFFVSVVKCSNCNEESTTLEPFACLQLPLTSTGCYSVYDDGESRAAGVFPKLPMAGQVRMWIAEKHSKSLDMVLLVHTDPLKGVMRDYDQMCSSNVVACFIPQGGCDKVSWLECASSSENAQCLVGKIAADCLQLRGREDDLDVVVDSALDVPYVVPSKFTLTLQEDGSYVSDVAKSARLKFDGNESSSRIRTGVFGKRAFCVVDSAFLSKTRDAPKIKLLTKNDKVYGATIADYNDQVCEDFARANAFKRTKDSVNLHTLLERFQAEEDLDSAYECGVCPSKTKATKRIEVYRFPKMLVIHLKRFLDNARKDSKCVEFPIDALDLGEWCCEKKGEMLYDLVGVSDHFGSLGGGHYSARVRRDGQWFCADDETVSVEHMERNECESSDAYVLYYLRR